MSIRAQSPLALQPTAARRAQQPRSLRLKALPLALVTASGLSLGLVGGTAQAATIVVNDGGDAASASVCILRDAVRFMQNGSILGTTGCTNTGGAFGTADTITFGNAITTVNLTQPFPLVYAVFNATRSLLIQGKGQGGITITRPSANGGLISQYGGDLTLDGITLTGGRTNNGGALDINLDGFSTKLQLKNSVITGNSALTAGAGIYVSPYSNTVATISITNSTISNNTAYGEAIIDGAGIYLGGASTLTMTGSTLSNNGDSSGTRWGGGIYAGFRSTVTLINSTLSNNVSFCEGAGLYAQSNGLTQAQVTLTSSTFAFNATQGECGSGGGLYQYGGSLTLNNSIMAGNTHNGNPADIGGSNFQTLTVNGTNNLVQNVSDAVIFTNARLTSDPLLSPLANNGGPTLTHALLSGSPAINAGGSTTLTTDQRGVGFQRVVGSAVDIGAFEAPINGTCGPASSATPVLAKPTTNLCSTGTATIVSGPQPYTWGCNGIGGGSTSTTATACSVPVQQWTVTPFVTTGPASGSINPSTVQTVNQNASTSFTLTPASGFAAGTATGCNGNLVGTTYTTGPVIGNCNVIASFTLTPINGACGTASSATPVLSAPTTNFCSTGTVTNFVGGTSGPWTWGCNGNVTGTSTAANACAVAARAGLTLLGNSVVIPGGAPTPLLINGTDFSSVTVGQSTTRSFVINNNGSIPLTVNSLSFVGPHASNFVVTSPTVFPIIVPAGQNLNFTVRFAPSAPGLRSATLAISADDGVASGASPQRLKALVATGFAVQGVGVAAAVVESIPVPTVGFFGLLAGMLGMLAAGVAALRRTGGKRER